MKKIILNGITLTQSEIYGVQRYATEILYELDKIICPGELEVIVAEKGQRELQFKNISVVKVPVDVSVRKQLRNWNMFGFSMYVKKCGGISMDLTLTLPIGKCDIVAIHDCIIERCKPNANTFRKKIGRLYYIFKAWLNIKRAKAVITVSEYSKNDIIRLYHISKKKIAVIGNAWQHFDRVIPDKNVLEQLDIKDRDFIFALGSRSFHKNFKWIAEAAKQNPKYVFVVSGSSNLSTSDKALDGSIKNLIYAGYLNDSEVKALMMHCKAFVQPSLYEGFGIPPMEAMSCGARCIVSKATSLPEIYGKSVWYIQPRKYDGINIDEIMSCRIEDNSRVLDRFSWARSARRLKLLIDKVNRE